MVISLSNAIYSVLFLILTFCNIAFILLLLGAEFFSFLLLIVYVGAIAVIFLFVIMMLSIKIEKKKKFVYFLIPSILLILFVVGNSFIDLNAKFDLLLNDSNQLFWTSWILESNAYSNIEAIGLVLYTDFSFLFLIASFVLLVAMIGVIILTIHQKSNVKKQKIEYQLMRSSKNVIKFLKLRS